MLSLKFSPFVKSIEYVYYKENQQQKQDAGKKHLFYGKIGKSNSNKYSECAIIEVYSEVCAEEILQNYINQLQPSDGLPFNDIASPREVKIVDKNLSYSEWMCQIR